jgi:hypothetical protein
MLMNCEVILRGDATPEQQRAVGVALWPLSTLAVGAADICRHFDNQALAGQLLTTEAVTQYTGLPRVQFLVRGDPARDRESMLENLRRTIPCAGVVDVRVAGMSWRPAEGTRRTTESV